jgi:hypothetical protein
MWLLLVRLLRLMRLLLLLLQLRLRYRDRCAQLAAAVAPTVAGSALQPQLAAIAVDPTVYGLVVAAAPTSSLTQSFCCTVNISLPFFVIQSLAEVVVAKVFVYTYLQINLIIN